MIFALSTGVTRIVAGPFLTYLPLGPWITTCSSGPRLVMEHRRNTSPMRAPRHTDPHMPQKIGGPPLGEYEISEFWKFRYFCWIFVLFMPILGPGRVSMAVSEAVRSFLTPPIPT